MHSRPKFGSQTRRLEQASDFNVLQPILELKMKPQERLMTVCLRVVLKFQPFEQAGQNQPMPHGLPGARVSEQDGRPNPGHA